jgi:hypothetical protein
VDHRGEAYDGRSYIESSHINMVAFKGTENAHLVLSLLVLPMLLNGSDFTVGTSQYMWIHE